VIAIDTNLLIYAHREGAPWHAAAKEAIERAAAAERGWGIPLPCVAEFWAQVTHPKYPDGPSPREACATFLLNLVHLGGAEILPPGLAFAERLAALAQQLEVSGHRIFDLQIALAAQDHGAFELWTHDSHFIRVPGLRIVDPLLAGPA